MCRGLLFFSAEMIRCGFFLPSHDALLASIQMHKEYGHLPPSSSKSSSTSCQKYVASGTDLGTCWPNFQRRSSTNRWSVCRSPHANQIAIISIATHALSTWVTTLFPQKPPQPPQPRRSPRFWPVFTPNPSIKPQLINQREQIRIVNFANIGFMPFRHAGYLDVAYLAGGQVAAQVHREVAFDDLAVVQVHLHFEVEGAYFGQHAVGFGLAV